MSKIIVNFKIHENSFDFTLFKIYSKHCYSMIEYINTISAWKIELFQRN